MKAILFSKQDKAYQYLNDTTTNEVLYGGGARGGKSWLGCVWQCRRRIRYPGSAGLIARAELKKLQDTTQLTFFNVLSACGLKKHVIFNAQSQVATFRNGSRIFFTEIKRLPSDPEYDRLGSYDLTDCFIDEAQQVDAKAISVLKGRFSLLKGKGGSWRTMPKALYTCNPAKNWIYSDFVLPHRLGTLTPRRKFVAALPADNPHCTQEYLDNLLTADRITVQRLVYGNFDYDDDPALLCEYDAILDCFTNDFIKPGSFSQDGHIPPTYAPQTQVPHHRAQAGKYLSADLAMQGRDKFIAGVWDGMVCTVSLEQAKSTGAGIEQDLRRLAESHCVPRSHIVADSDGLGSYLSSYMEGIQTFHAGSRACNEALYANKKAECAYKLAEKINKREIRIVCTEPQKQRIIEELGVLKAADIDNDGKKRIIEKKDMRVLLGRSPDFLDMLIMRMFFEVRPPEALTMVWRRQDTPHYGARR